jgi:CRP-like cAMP-binding protein
VTDEPRDTSRVCPGCGRPVAEDELWIDAAEGVDAGRLGMSELPDDEMAWGRRVRFHAGHFRRRIGQKVYRPVRDRSEPLPSVARSTLVDTSRVAAFSVFADLPAAELDELAAAISVVEIEAGAKVVTLDDYGTAIYFIEAGEAEVVTDDGEQTHALGPGDTFGEIALLLTGQRTATVVARTPMRLLSLSGQDFERIQARVPELERSLRRLGVERAGR